MCGEIRARPAPGGNGNGPGPERLAAGDIPRRISDHVDLGWLELHPMLFACPCLGEEPELIAIVMIVRESAELEKVPDAVVLEFQARAARDVASQEGKDNAGTSAQFFEKFKDARKQFADALGQLEREKMDVRIEKCGYMNRRRLKTVLEEDVFDNIGVCHPGDLDVGEIVFNLETFFERPLQRKNAGVAGMDERSIDVEKKKTLIQNFGFRIADCGIISERSR